jgi:hypothetical protein
VLLDEPARVGIDAQIQCSLKMLLCLFAVAAFEVYHAKMVAIESVLRLSLDDFVQQGNGLQVILSQIITPG